MKLVDYLNSLPWFKVTVETLPNDSKQVKLYCSIYKNKTQYIYPTFSSEYSDYEVLYSPEVEKALIGITGAKQVTSWTL